MPNEQHVKELEARVKSLEIRNKELEAAATTETKPRVRGRLQKTLAFILIFVSVLLAPIAVIGNWVRLELVETDSFVNTFAPLTRQPSVQGFITDQVVEAIEQNVDIDGLVNDLFDGIASLDLPPRATAALTLLEGPAAQGVRSIISSATLGLVSSPQFSNLWEIALRETHARTIAIIQGDPNALVQLSNDGSLSLELGPLIAGVKEQLLAQGFGFASEIPVVEKSIPLAEAAALGQVRLAYKTAVAFGFWLPWIVLALLAGAVLVSPNRRRALAWAAGAVGASLLLLSAGLGTGRMFFLAQVSPSIMPRETGVALFDHLIYEISSTLTALIILSVIVVFSVWVTGHSPAAQTVRGWFNEIVKKLRHFFSSKTQK